MNKKPEEMTDAELEAKVNSIADEIEEICLDEEIREAEENMERVAGEIETLSKQMEAQGELDDEAIAEAGVAQAIKDLNKICKEFDQAMKKFEKEFGKKENK